MRSRLHEHRHAAREWLDLLDRRNAKSERLEFPQDLVACQYKLVGQSTIE